MLKFPRVHQFSVPAGVFSHQTLQYLFSIPIGPTLELGWKLIPVSNTVAFCAGMCLVFIQTLFWLLCNEGYILAGQMSSVVFQGRSNL